MFIEKLLEVRKRYNLTEEEFSSLCASYSADCDIYEWISVVGEVIGYYYAGKSLSTRSPSKSQPKKYPNPNRNIKGVCTG